MILGRNRSKLIDFEVFLRKKGRFEMKNVSSKGKNRRFFWKNVTSYQPILEKIEDPFPINFPTFHTLLASNILIWASSIAGGTVTCATCVWAHAPWAIRMVSPL